MPKQRANVKTDSKDLRCTKQSFIGPNNYSPVHPSKASMMGHFGGVLGEWVGVCTRGWAGFPTSSHPGFCYSILKGSKF